MADTESRTVIYAGLLIDVQSAKAKLFGRILRTFRLVKRWRWNIGDGNLRRERISHALDNASLLTRSIRALGIA